MAVQILYISVIVELLLSGGFSELSFVDGLSTESNSASSSLPFSGSVTISKVRSNPTHSLQSNNIYQ